MSMMRYQNMLFVGVARRSKYTELADEQFLIKLLIIYFFELIC